MSWPRVLRSETFSLFESLLVLRFYPGIMRELLLTVCQVNPVELAPIQRTLLSREDAIRTGMTVQGIRYEVCCVLSHLITVLSTGFQCLWETFLPPQQHATIWFTDLDSANFGRSNSITPRSCTDGQCTVIPKAARASACTS
jgi:hypothetical protein